MIDLYSTEPEFEAEITILTSDQGGRNKPPHNYIRWDFGYAEDKLSETIHAIWPNFLDDCGSPIPKGIPLHGTLVARMHIVFRDVVDFHRSRIRVGTKFNCHEGSRVVAKGTVTRVLALSG
ncbi:MAG: hypothetical protein AAFR93_03715 [Pseudomonadota bacterium]